MPKRKQAYKHYFPEYRVFEIYRCLNNMKKLLSFLHLQFVPTTFQVGVYTYLYFNHSLPYYLGI